MQEWKTGLGFDTIRVQFVYMSFLQPIDVETHTLSIFTRYRPSDFGLRVINLWTSVGRLKDISVRCHFIGVERLSRFLIHWFSEDEFKPSDADWTQRQ